MGDQKVVRTDTTVRAYVSTDSWGLDAADLEILAQRYEELGMQEKATHEAREQAKDRIKEILAENGVAYDEEVLTGSYVVSLGTRKSPAKADLKTLEAIFPEAFASVVSRAPDYEALTVKPVKRME